MTDVAKMRSHNSAKNTKRRALRAMRFAENTCAASRHVLQIAEAIESQDCFYGGFDEYEAASLYSVLESLWKARTKIAKMQWER